MLFHSVNENSSSGTSEPTHNNSFREFLSNVNPGYIEVVPDKWLDLELPSEIYVFGVSIYLLVLCIPGNFSQLLVMLAYRR